MSSHSIYILYKYKYEYSWLINVQLKKVINPFSWFHVNPKCGKYGLLTTTEIHNTHTRSNSQLHMFNTKKKFHSHAPPLFPSYGHKWGGKQGHKHVLKVLLKLGELFRSLCTIKKGEDISPILVASLLCILYPC